MLHIWIVTTFCQAFIPRAGRIPRESDKGAQGNLWAKICGLIYSKHPHIRTHDFGGQADCVLI